MTYNTERGDEDNETGCCNGEFSQPRNTSLYNIIISHGIWISEHT